MIENPTCHKKQQVDGGHGSPTLYFVLRVSILLFRCVRVVTSVLLAHFLTPPQSHLFYATYNEPGLAVLSLCGMAGVA